MQFVTVLALAGMASAAAVTTRCNANDCLRQVRATNFPTRMGTADCAAYQSTTIYTSTVVTSTAFSGTAIAAVITPPPNQPVRAIPTYASSCGDDTEYRSACSCAGVTSAITTTTATFTATAVCSTVRLQATSGARAGNYFVHSGTSTSGTEFLSSTNAADAQLYELRDGRFYRPGTNNVLLNANIGGRSSLFLDTQYDANLQSYAPLTCNIDPVSGAVACVLERGTGGDNSFQIDTAGGAGILFGPAAQATGTYQLFVPKAIAACA